MGLNSRGGNRGNKANFHLNARFRGGMMYQGTMSTSGPSAMFCPPAGFPLEGSCGEPSFFRGPGFNFGPSKPAFRKLPLKSFKRRTARSQNGSYPSKNISIIREHYCETCDKSFKTSDDLILHKTEHETCGRDGCQFTAHPKIIAKHIKMQHLTGLYQRIAKFSTAEDIAKWIEERRKRYPTTKVVEEKKLLEKEKLNRGERINENSSKFNKSFCNKSSKKRNFRKKGNKRRTKKKKKTCAIHKLLEEETPAFRRGVPAFLGIKNKNELEKPEKNDLEISDEEWETECKPPAAMKPLLSSSLKLLATCYDSNEEDFTEELNKETNVEHMSADEGSGPEEVKTVCSKNPLLEDKLNKENFSKQKDNQLRKNKNTIISPSLEPRRLSLLEKLLKNEIRHERNVILQCIHHVVKNNFFKT